MATYRRRDEASSPSRPRSRVRPCGRVRRKGRKRRRGGWRTAGFGNSSSRRRADEFPQVSGRKIRERPLPSRRREFSISPSLATRASLLSRLSIAVSAYTVSYPFVSLPPSPLAPSYFLFLSLFLSVRLLRASLLSISVVGAAALVY